MLAIKAQYRQGRIELIEPMPADILSAELNIASRHRPHHERHL